MSEQQIVAIDSQRLTMIQTCAYKYNNVFNLNLVPVEKANPLERGSFIHEMLDAYYTLRVSKGVWRVSEDFRNKFGSCFTNDPTVDSLIDVIKICVAIGEDRAVPMSVSIEDLDDVIRTFKEYVEFYQNEPHETLAVEAVAARVMYEDPELVIIYETKIDWTVRLPNVPLIPWDHKTYSRRGPVNPLDNQFLGYCWMLEVNNIGINRIGLQRTIAPKDKFLRPIMSYPTAVIEGWRDNTIWWVKQMLRHQNHAIWPMNFTSCGKYDGCIFQELCITQPDMRNWKARSLFNIGEPWDVGANL